MQIRVATSVAHSAAAGISNRFVDARVSVKALAKERSGRDMVVYESSTSAAQLWIELAMVTANNVVI